MVFPEPSDTSPPFPLHTLPSSGSFSLSASGSLQTHLSSFNSEQRLRSLPSVTEDLEKQPEPDSDDSDDEIENEYNRPTAGKLQFFWLVNAFVWFSTLFFPISVFRDSGFFSPSLTLSPLDENYESGSLRSLWENERLLSKITTLDLRPARFRYSVFGDLYNSHDLTACVWFNLADFDGNLMWLRGWPGPASLILSVDRPSDLDVAQVLLRRMMEAHSNDTLSNQRVSYLIYLKGSAGEQPNAYLNLARLISQTNYVVLLPKLLSALHPGVTYSHFYNSTHLHSPNGPVVLVTSRKNSVFPFNSFSPLMVHRDDTTWCDERFDFIGSPSTAWEECLWQFWITKHGGIQPVVSKDPWKMVPHANWTTAVFEERLRDHFHDEICSLVTRNTLALIHSLDDHDAPSSQQQQQQQVPAKYAAQRRWLKKHCHKPKVKGL